MKVLFRRSRWITLRTGPGELRVEPASVRLVSLAAGLQAFARQQVLAHQPVFSRIGDLDITRPGLAVRLTLSRVVRSFSRTECAWLGDERL